MSTARSITADAVALLLRLEARRGVDGLRHPRVGAWAATLLPLALVVAGLWSAGEAARPDAADGQGRILLGALASIAPALGAYPILFRPADDGLLRRLGVPAQASFVLRALRLAALAFLAFAVMLVPYLATGADLVLPAVTAGGAALAAWGVSLLSHARAARLLGIPARKPGISARLMGPDGDLVATAPLVYAPLLPLVVGVVAGRFASAGMAGEVAWRLPVVLLTATGCAALAARWFAIALPRFAPRATEMAFAPAPGAGETGLVIGRGLAAVLPRRAGAVRARDAAVVERRFRWAGRAAWTVAVVAVLALLRAGASAEVRGWVAAAAGLVLAAQSVAVIALGRLERGGPRWIDRASGIRLRDRLLGRWALGFGMSLALVLPLALVWGLTVPTSPGWPWMAAAAATAAIASAASLAAAGR